MCVGLQHGALVTIHMWGRWGLSRERGQTYLVCRALVRRPSSPALSINEAKMRRDENCMRTSRNVYTVVSARTHEQWRRPDSFVDRNSPRIGTPWDVCDSTNPGRHWPRVVFCNVLWNRDVSVCIVHTGRAGDRSPYQLVAWGKRPKEDPSY